MVVRSSSRRQILLAVENELITISTQTGCDGHTSHLEGENITVFLLTVLQKLDRLPNELITMISY
jgi:hypothetical protein